MGRLACHRRAKVPRVCLCYARHSLPLVGPYLLSVPFAKTRKPVNIMLVTEVFARAALLGTMALPAHEIETLPNPSGLLSRQTSGCSSTDKACLNTCIPMTGICCK